jgi:hypothetical protein
MTYIKRQRRVAVDPIIDGLVKRLREIGPLRDDLSYAVTRLVTESLRPSGGWDRHSLNDCTSVLYEVGDEIHRRLSGAYEDEQIAVNGDMECFTDSLPPIQAALSDKQIQEVEDQRVQNTKRD